MNNELLTAGLFAIGGLVYALWGLLNAYNATKSTTVAEVFDWGLFASSVIPIVVTSFVAGITATAPSGLADVVVLVTAGYGTAKLTSKLDVGSYFRAKTA